MEQQSSQVESHEGFVFIEQLQRRNFIHLPPLDTQKKKKIRCYKDYNIFGFDLFSINKFGTYRFRCTEEAFRFTGDDVGRTY